MYILFIISSISVIFITVTLSDDELVCKENEIVNTCPGNCTNDFCPTSQDSDVCTSFVSTPAACGSPVCQCRFNYMRNCENDTCIPTRDCPPFDCSARPNEEFNPCPPICPSDDCSQATPTGQCPLPGIIGIVLQCRPKCRCIKGYWRYNGICVPYNKCPGKCPQNEEFSNCTQALCRAQNCSQKGQPIACPAIAEGSCRQGCVCKKSFLRAGNGSCVPEDQCSDELVCKENEIVNTCPGNCTNDFCPTSQDSDVCTSFVSTPAACGSPVCQCRFNYMRNCENDTCIPTRDCPPFDCSARPNEEFNPCPPICPSDDCSQATPTGQCPLPGIIGIVLQCRPKCRCIKGYWRYNGICVPYNKCPGKCPQNEEFSNCTQALCRAQNCSQKGQPIACPAIAEGSCRQGCVCKKSFLRAGNGSCVPEDQCSELTCGKNEMLNTCPNACDDDRCPEKATNQNKDDCFSAAVCLSPKCQCIKKYKRLQNKTCVPEEYCPCPPNEEFSNCTQAINRPLNCSQRGQSLNSSAVKKRSCKSGCVCKAGFLRTAVGDCIPDYRCYGTLVCGVNETVNTCPGNCTSDFCPTNNNRMVCSETNKGQDSCGPPVCKCRFNYRRSRKTRHCIPARECPPFKCNGCNEEFNSCPPACPTDDCNEASPTGKCLRPGFSRIVVECKPQCRCIKNYWRYEGSCVPYDECPERNGYIPKEQLITDVNHVL